MPGILPMKVIKMGTSSQSRIAQACDRCRSKKIRCDGVRPCCTQCASVGFECKTSDKLSRRAFPRGYTESLEERVRSLEAEVRDLKDLLDERDEKIEVLSRIHSFSSPRQKASFQSSSSSTAAESTTTSSEPSQPVVSSDDTVTTLPEIDDILTLSHPAKSTPNATFAGPSSVRAFSSKLITKLEEQGISPSSFSTKALTAFPARNSQRLNSKIQSPPRLLSDQLVNIYFQEWAPLYPIVHRPTILKAYDRYLADPSLLKDRPLTIIQLNLIFSIASLSSKSRTNQDPKIFEQNWYTQLEYLCRDASVSAMQCIVLAQMYFLIKGDYQSLIRYRALGVSLAYSLGLNESQKQFALDPLTTETRKKVFWCQYILDRFAAAATGLPIMLLDSQISTEIPTDIDDEYVTKDGFLSGLPNEFTRMSSALALLEASKILGKALQVLYPSAPNSEISMTKLYELSEELDTWNKSLPAHLQLIFIQDKPSTNMTGSRSPLLSLMYYYIRILIHRPAACFGNSNIMKPAMLNICDASKHIIQILQLLDERSLSLSLAINRLELVYLSGLGFLWQNMSLERGSKLVQESQKMISAAVLQLKSESTAAATEFYVLSNIIAGGDTTRPGVSDRTTQESKRHSDVNPNAKSSKFDGLFRRKTVSNINTSQKRSQQPRQRSGAMDPPQAISRHKSFDLSTDVNVDYYPMNADTIRSMSSTDVSKMALTAAEWECILSDLDHGSLNIFNGIYGGQDCAGQPGLYGSANISGHSPQYGTGAAVPIMQHPARLSPHDSSSEAWSASSSGDISHVPDNLLGYSPDNKLGVKDEVSPVNDYDLQQSLHMADSVKGLMIPSTEDDFVDLSLFDGLDRSLMT